MAPNNPEALFRGSHPQASIRGCQVSAAAQELKPCRHFVTISVGMPCELVLARSIREVSCVTLWAKITNYAPPGSLTRNIGWMFFGQGIGYSTRVIYFILIARLLGVLQYGIVVGAYALVNMVAGSGGVGTGLVFLRYVSADRSEFAVYWGNILLVTVSMSCLLIALLNFLIAPHVIDPASAAIVLLMAIAACFCEQLTVELYPSVPSVRKKCVSQRCSTC